ncbi:sulfatase-like hydrolase/transferase [Nocardioides sp. YIM 152315]|uniref:sulfatase-like hydrolase/transferase n=1 Tax=Nocardioides sp. YIM 152315 TaxID=3031760 RepID=UPI0023DA8435|nr:sulfatase-like hydrolase/transferase [Nocardioides sp. YIM 152315]MDF1602506.1 sulfatase-like hydrolase/transferase [Nocardioides sp. YIM 152315]
MLLERGAPRRHPVRSVLLTGLATLPLLAVLNVPERLDRLEVAAFVRLPLELLALVAIALLLPVHRPRLRTTYAVAVGLLLAVAGVLRVLDLGFREALNRPFDPLVDWQYAGRVAGTLRASVGDGLGTLLLVAATLLGLVLLVALPFAVLRLTRAAARDRAAAGRVVAALAALWLVLALLDVRTDGRAAAGRGTAAYVYDQVARIPGELAERREFARAAQQDPYRDVPGSRLLGALRGKDVLIVFVESYGRVAVEDPDVSPGVGEVLADGTADLAGAGFGARTAWLTSPTFGAVSWLAHATLQSGLWVDSEQRYDQLVTSPRLTLSRLFRRAGWRTVADVPANTHDWAQAGYYDFDRVYDSRDVGYQGPRFGYPTMPDQYTLDAFHRLELAPGDRRPVMAEIDLISSHAPWSRTPRMVAQSAVGDGSVYDGMPETLPSERDIWPDPDRVRAAYGAAVEYSLRSVVSFLTTYGDDDTVVLLLGDHQPATIVSGPDATFDVPVSVIARDPAVLDRISEWDWRPGLRPAADAPVWRMDALRDRFLAAYARATPRRERTTR